MDFSLVALLLIVFVCCFGAFIPVFEGSCLNGAHMSKTE